MKTLYILELQNRKWYIGTTNRPLQERVLEHFEAMGAEWTKRYPPVKVAYVLNGVDNFEEDKQTKVYMAQYGIDAVRGGSYVQIELPNNQLNALQLELRTGQNACFTCGQIGHYANNCKGNDGFITWGSTCVLCEKTGHCVNDCPIKTVNRDEYCLHPQPLPVGLRLITDLRPWQREVENIILRPPHARHIYWYWAPGGNFGKSSLCKYLVCKYYNYCICSSEIKPSTIAKLANARYCVYLFDPVYNARFTVWSGLEQLKDGLIPKANITMKPPHVFFFANSPPNTDTMGADRLVVVRVNVPSCFV